MPDNAQNNAVDHPNRNNNTEPYRNACLICRVLIERIVSPKTPASSLSFLVREWRETEFAKREWRGLPRLLGHKLEEVMAARMKSAKRLTTRGAIDEAPDAPAQAKPADIEPNELDAPESQTAGETPPQTDVPPQAT